MDRPDYKVKNLDWLKKNGNMFWESVSNIYLLPILTKVYKEDRKLKKIKRWLKDEKRVIMLEVDDSFIDPFFIILYGDGFELGTEREDPDIIIRGSKTKLILHGPDLFRMILSSINKELEIKFKNLHLKDLLMFVKILYVWR